MNSSLDNRQRAPNPLIFSSCAVLVPLFQCMIKEWQEKVFVGALMAVEIMCWKQVKIKIGKLLLPKVLLIYCFILCFHSKLCLWVVLSLEFY